MKAREKCTFACPNDAELDMSWLIRPFWLDAAPTRTGVKCCLSCGRRVWERIKQNPGCESSVVIVDLAKADIVESAEADAE